MHAVDEHARVANHHPARAIDRRYRVIATLGDEVRTIFLHLAALQQGPDRRMLLHLLDQCVRRDFLCTQVGQQASDADRQRLGVGIEESRADHALRDLARHLNGDAFLRSDIESALDRRIRQEMNLLDGERHVARLQFRMKSRLLGEQRIDAVGENHNVGVDRAAGPVGFDTDHAISVHVQPKHRRFANGQRTGILHFFRKPFVELCANDRVTIIGRRIECLRAVGGSDIGIVVEHPHALLDQMTLERRVVAKIRNDLLQRVRIEDRSLYVFRARGFAPLDLQHAQTRLGGGVRRGLGGAD